MNYVLLAQAALVGAVQLRGPTLAQWERVAVSAVGVMAWVAGVWLLLKLETSIKARRDRLKNSRAGFSREFQAAWETPAKASDSTIPVAFLGMAMSVGLLIMLRLVWSA
jgi:hypothetical protein